MGSASRQSLAAAVSQLAATTGVTITTGEQLLAAARAFDESAQLRAILGDPSVAPADKSALVARIMPGLEKPAAAVLDTIVASSWSNGGELVDGIEQVGIRAIARGEGHSATIESQLFSFARVVASDPELELTLGNKLAAAQGKAEVVDRLIGTKAVRATVVIVDHLVRSPRGRRIGEMLAAAADVVAAAGERRVATVTSAVPLSAAQQTRLAAALARQYGSDIQLNLVVDPTVVGGARVQLGGDVIDGTISARLAELKLQLAG
ncbi:F0F1 ATP synthase subunit delta [Lysinimonas soli]|uniref:ATP synthase subunit delta n=1 Tax=Lysinimonas soli TaxID=1074233 RepID=A0ABW0NMD7_9MICO